MTDDVLEYTEELCKSNPDDFWGLHDCHGIGEEGEKTVKKIFSQGLLCSRMRSAIKGMPYQQNYRTVSYDLNNELEKIIENLKSADSNTDIILIRIPKQIIDLIENHGYDSTIIFKIISKPVHFTGRQDENFKKIITLSKPSETNPANANSVPPYFIYSCYDQSKSKEIKNENYFDNLPDEEKELIIKNVQERYKKYKEESQSQMS